MPLPEKPYFVELAERELFAAVAEWVVDATCAQRKLTPVEERLFRAQTNYTKAKQQTSEGKGSGTHKIGAKKPEPDGSGL